MKGESIMFEEIYVWLESYGGTSFDFDESIQEIGETEAIVDPFTWHTGIDIILTQLDEACDIIDEYWRAIPEGMPNRKKMKRMLTENVLGLIVGNIRSICNMLNLNLEEIKTMDQLHVVIDALYELINLLRTHTIDEIIKNGLYDQHEEENDNSFANVLNVMKEDMAQLAMNVTSIQDEYYDSLDNEDLDELY